MATYRQLKIDLLKDQNVYLRNIEKILLELSKADQASFLQPIDRAVASRTLIKKLWDFLPDEHDSYQFSSVEEQTIYGKGFVPTADFKQTVTLHLSWDVLSFSCSLEAAWQTWKDFNILNIETFNCCVYPESLEWYVIRAGTNLYPMTLIGDKYDLKAKQGSL